MATDQSGIHLHIPPPNPRQEEFFLAREKYIAYGGARAGGKSWAVRVKALCGALSTPGLRILILRRTYPELEATVVAPLLALLATAEEYSLGQKIPAKLAQYHATQRLVDFPNGAVIKFGHLQNQGGLTEYQGQEYDWIFLDEATHFTEFEFRALGACLRGTRPIPRRFYLTCNPGGVGHQWVKRLFVTGDYVPGREQASDYRFIPATVEDNMALDEVSRADYIQFLDLLPPEMRAAHRFGDWDALSGQFFTQFRPEIHCYQGQLPKDWVRVRAFDYGLDMLACLWAAIDPTGKIWVYRELFRSGLVVSQSAQAILEHTGVDEEIAINLAPPDIWSTQKDSGRTMAELFALHGLPLVRAPSRRSDGWMNVREFLQPDGGPRLKIHASCGRLIHDLQALQYDPSDPSDCATQPHDVTHGPDALRYLCASRCGGLLGENMAVTVAPVGDWGTPGDGYL